MPHAAGPAARADAARALQNKTLKGRKVEVPGQKGKHKIPEDVVLTVGAMGLKIMDGSTVVASYLLAKLASWEATGGTLRVSVSDEKQSWVEFGTDEGSQICEDILTIAKQLVAQRKKDEQTKLEMKQQAQERRKASGSTDFSVTQSYWSAKKKSKVPARVQLGVTVDGVRITASVDGEDEVIETITVQNIVSWETIKDKDTFRLTVSSPPPHPLPPNQTAC